MNTGTQASLAKYMYTASIGKGRQSSWVNDAGQVGTTALCSSSGE